MLLQLSYDLIQAVKARRNIDYIRIINLLEGMSQEDLFIELDNDAKKMCFWINIYNAYFQLLTHNKFQQHQKIPTQFFKAKQLNICKTQLSFDAIEHSILRRSKWKYGLGYIPVVLIPKKIKNLRVKIADNRIHFLLNCGAKSCPVIFALNPVNIDQQLENATLDYLEATLVLNTEKHQIEINQLFLFYLADFGGRQGIRKLLYANQFINSSQMKYKIVFKAFNKSLKLHNFKENN